MDCGGMTCLPDRQTPLSLHAPPTVSALELSHTLEPIHRAAKAGTCPGTCPRSPKSSRVAQIHRSAKNSVPAPGPGCYSCFPWRADFVYTNFAGLVSMGGKWT